ncbi:hypothetical protein RFI_18644, partial [Reticulomyxa filosa]
IDHLRNNQVFIKGKKKRKSRLCCFHYCYFSNEKKMNKQTVKLNYFETATRRRSFLLFTANLQSVVENGPQTPTRKCKKKTHKNTNKKKNKKTAISFKLTLARMKNKYTCAEFFSIDPKRPKLIEDEEEKISLFT